MELLAVTDYCIRELQNTKINILSLQFKLCVLKALGEVEISYMFSQMSTLSDRY